MNILRKTPRLALALAIIFVIWLAIAMFGAKFGLIDKLFAFGTMTIGWGLIAAGIIGVLALIGIVVSLVMKPRSGFLSALLALIVPLAFFGGLAGLQSTAAKFPFIYDITTNTDDAPAYSADLLQARADAGANPMIDFAAPLGQQDMWKGNAELADVTAATLIAEGYPDLETLYVQHSPEDVLAAVKGAMEMRGFSGVVADEDAGTVEGTATVFWYGFQDDIIARIRAVEGGVNVDFRSTSRVGTSDLGVNAERIADLSKAVEDRLAEDYPRDAAVEEPADDDADEADAAEAGSDSDPAAVSE